MTWIPELGRTKCSLTICGSCDQRDIMQQRLKADDEIRITAHASADDTRATRSGTQLAAVRLTVANSKGGSTRMTLHHVAWHLPK